MPQAWRRALAFLAVAWLANFVLFAADWAGMVTKWWDISTYNHVLLVPAIIAWLVWQRAPKLAQLVPAPWWPALPAVCAGAMAWVLGSFAGLTFARELGVVLMLIASVPLALGPRVSAGLAFPLGYMLLLVPFGDELVPALQMITADITIFLVHLSGIEAQIDGVFIDTPAGLFEVAEACSGVKFLIAMIAFGLLVANVCLRSPVRRVLLLATCVAVPVLANGVRAWGTVYAAQFIGAERAAGMDHLIYGWVFFAVVMALVLGMWWRFFDRPVDEPAVDLDAIAASRLLARLEVRPVPASFALVALGVIMLGALGWAHAAERLRADLPPVVALPQVPGWQGAAYQPSFAWNPRATGAGHRLLGSYADAQGRRVDVFYALYAAQNEGGEAGGFGEGALTPESGWAWNSPGPAFGAAKSERLQADNGTIRLAVTWYRTGDLLSGSNLRLKLANMADRLILRAAPTAMLIVTAEDRPDMPADQAISAFIAAAGPTGPWMDRIGGIR